MKHLPRIAWVGLLVTALMLLGALNAQASSAHAARLSSEPADNAVLAAGPKQVSATFNERLQTTFAAMTVVGPDGNLWSTGDPSVDEIVTCPPGGKVTPWGGLTVTVKLTPDPPGLLKLLIPSVGVTGFTVTARVVPRGSKFASPRATDSTL